MNTSQAEAEAEARRYLDTVTRRSGARLSAEQYDRALRKAAASIGQLQEAVRLANRQKESVE